jgi:cyclophilin family peptidyl-prolyl cis-trans isomerase
MTNKELFTKLDSLKSINPDSAWVSGNRDLLLSQISNSGACTLSAWKVFVINCGSFAKVASRPAYALGAFVLMLIVGSLFSHQVLGNAKPNDSLYIARIISEKVKLNTMFNSDERNKLAVQFATGHAQDISVTLSDPEFNNEDNRDQVAKLNENFNKEIDSVKTHISYLSQKATTKVNQANEIINATDTVSMANSLKDNAGVQLFENLDLTGTMPLTAPRAIAPAVDLLDATSAIATSAVSTENTSEQKEMNADFILDEAKQLFENKDYNRAADKLKEVDEIIKN